MFEHNEFARKHHQQIVNKGYWDSPKEIGTLLMLVISEIIKLFDEDRINHSEKLADVALRIYDLCGYYKIELDELPVVTECSLYSMIAMLTNELEAQRVDINTKWVYLKRCLSMTYLFAEKHQIDLPQEIVRKSEILKNMNKKKF